MELEAPHRALHKETKGAKGKEFIEKCKAWHASATPEEIKAFKAEKKRKREESGADAPSKKKKAAAKFQPFTCKVCETELTTAQLVSSHIKGKSHFKKVKEYNGGCWLCAVPPHCDDSHF